MTKTRKIKKLASLLLALTVMLSMLAIAPITANAETSGDFEYEILDDGTAEITEYTGSAAELEIPSELDGNTVTSIGYKAFCDCTSLTNVKIPDSVTSIGSDAFSGCTSLTDIIIPESVTSIGGYAFDDTAWYDNWYDNQSDGVVYIGKVVYAYKGKIPENTSIVLEDGTIGIAGSAFESCENLISITIPNSVTDMGDGAFYGCISLESVTIPDSVTSIGESAFLFCTSLTSVTIPDSVTGIGIGAFGYCESLTSITIPDSVTSIGESAFEGCDDLTIYGCTGSAAETYANDNDIAFISLGEAAEDDGQTDGSSNLGFVSSLGSVAVIILIVLCSVAIICLIVFFVIRSKKKRG